MSYMPWNKNEKSLISVSLFLLFPVNLLALPLAACNTVQVQTCVNNLRTVWSLISQSYNAWLTLEITCEILNIILKHIKCKSNTMNAVLSTNNLQGVWLPAWWRHRSANFRNAKIQNLKFQLRKAKYMTIYGLSTCFSFSINFYTIL